MNYPIAGAASILAKVTRDAEIEIMKEEFGDFGSGYPSDRKTIAFIADYFSKNDSIPPFMRSAWKTLDKYKKKPRSVGQQISQPVSTRGTARVFGQTCPRDRSGVVQPMSYGGGFQRITV